MNPADLRIIKYPDPRLRKVSMPVGVFDEPLKLFVERLYELMRGERGVGLAAPQVGVNLRVFVMNPTGKPGDDHAYINPELSDAAGEDEAEEGCLSLPKITVNVLRSKKLRIRAQDLDGKAIEHSADGYIARIWQHETDHLDGILLLDKMTEMDKLAARKALREMEEEYAARNPPKKKR